MKPTLLATLPMSLFAVGGALALTQAASAQVSSGTIAMCSLDPNQFSLIDPSGQVVTAYPLSNTDGSGGTTNTNSILWDPSQPQSFFLGGEGFIGRVTITGFGTSNYQLITNQIGIVSQLSLDPNGKLVAIDSTSSQAVLVDPANGAITPITSGPQPWGTELNCGALDPFTGDLFLGTDNAMYVIRNGSSTPILLSSTWTTSHQTAYSTGIAFDPNTGDMVVSILTADKIVKMDKQTGAITDMCPPHSIQSCNSVAFEPTGDIVVGGWQNKLWRIPNAGGSPSLITTVSNQGFLATAVAVVGNGCGGQIQSYGSGCAGSGGFVPLLELDGCAAENQTVTLSISQGLGGSSALLLFGLAPGVTPLGPNCSILVTPLLGNPLPLPLFGANGVPGAGNISFPGVIPTGTSGASFTLQALVVDSASFVGAVATNGIAVSIQ